MSSQSGEMGAGAGKALALFPSSLGGETVLIQAGRVLSKEQLQQSLYGWDEGAESNALEVHIHHLRRKLGSELIRTLRGVGYTIPK